MKAVQVGLILAAASLVTSCTSSTEAPVASRLAVTTSPSGSGQDGVPFTTQPTVQLEDASDKPVSTAGVVITVAVTDGGGALKGTTTATTSSSGSAAFTNLAVAGKTGARTLTFAAPGLTSATATVKLTAGPATTMLLGSGDGQSAIAGSATAVSPSVSIIDADSNAVAGTTVTFSVTAGGGSIAATSAMTDSLGVATAGSWTLGTLVGVNTISATAAGMTGSPITFTATGVPGPPASITKIAGDNQVAASSAALTVAPAVKVTDANGNTVPGASITFSVLSGNGSVSGATQLTNSSGIATLGGWTLGASIGVNTLSAAVDLSGLTAASFSATVRTMSIVAGQTFTCGLSTNGTAYCWGDNRFGQLGDGTTTNRLNPTAVAGGLTFQSLASGPKANQACGLTSAGAAYCWGYNSSGQLGDGTTTTRLTPVAILGGLTFQSLTVGIEHVCGITTTGAAYCWGINGNGELGTGSAGGSMIPVTVTGSLAFQSIAAGWYHTCGIVTGAIAVCWGANQLGAIGDSSSLNSRSAPTAVRGGLAFTSVTAGLDFSCGVTAGGAGYCWGGNQLGYLGTGDSTNSTVPKAIVGGHAFQSITAGGEHTCGIAVGGAAYCWGWSAASGNGSAIGTVIVSPTAVVGGLSFQALASGDSHTCGITTAGVAYCWGFGTDGRVGDGTTNLRSSPVLVRAH